MLCVLFPNDVDPYPVTIAKKITSKISISNRRITINDNSMQNLLQFWNRVFRPSNSRLSV